MGIGHLLSQKHCDCKEVIPGCCKSGWKVASRFCHPAEQNYSPVEGEALSAAAGLHKFKYFIMGCDKLYLVVDHKPLVKLLGDRNLEDIPNGRLLRLKEKTLQFKFKVVHRPGLLHKGPDFASRYPQGAPELFLRDEITTEDKELAEMVEEIEVAAHDEVAQAWQKNEVKSITWQMLKQATGGDPELAIIRETIEDGTVISDVIGEKLQVIKPYVRYWSRLWVQDGVVILDDRTVIPKRLRGRVLDCLHSAHQGVSQMFSRAEHSVFWPGMCADIEEKRANCVTCRTQAPSLPKLPAHEPPEVKYPFQQICSDFMSLKGLYHVSKIFDMLSIMLYISQIHKPFI